MIKTLLRVLVLGICIVALVAAFKEFDLYNEISYWFHTGVDWFSNLFSKI